MGLVGYSDSEASDDETPVAKPTVSSSTKPATRRPEPPKLLNKQSGKIQVNLTGASATSSAHEYERPAKRARTGGGLGFNALLPAPKNLNAKPAAARVNLKTGAQATFSRGPPELPPPQPNESSPPDDGPGNSDTAASAMALPTPKLDYAPPAQPDVKPKGNPFRFMPLSVSKKKKPPVAAAVASATPPLAPAVAPATSDTVPDSVPKKKKQSLFSAAPANDTPALAASSTHTYQPLLEDDAPAPGPAVDPPDAAPARSTSEPATVQSLAATLNLSAAERRQLFGRNGDAAAAAHVAQFNLANEYKANRQFAEAEGQGMQHNPVKSIAPGKHSLQQLINNAQTQGSALEEQFASGRRNKKEAGNKYGW